MTYNKQLIGKRYEVSGDNFLLLKINGYSVTLDRSEPSIILNETAFLCKEGGDVINEPIPRSYAVRTHGSLLNETFEYTEQLRDIIAKEKDTSPPEPLTLTDPVAIAFEAVRKAMVAIQIEIQESKPQPKTEEIPKITLRQLKHLFLIIGDNPLLSIIEDNSNITDDQFINIDSGSAFILDGIIRNKMHDERVRNVLKSK